MTGFARRTAAGLGERVRNVARFGRWGVLPHYIFFLVVLLTLVLTTALPLNRMMIERRREAELRAQIAEIRSDSQRLHREIDNLNDPAVVEAQARSRLGLVRPGETPLVAVEGPLPAPGSAPAAKKPTPQPNPKPTVVGAKPATSPSPTRAAPAASPTPTKR